MNLPQGYLRNPYGNVFTVEHPFDDQIKEREMAETCSRHGSFEKYIQKY
jgi:hypothetical protein